MPDSMAIRIADSSTERMFEEPEPIKSPSKHSFLHRIRNKLSGKEDPSSREQTPCPPTEPPLESPLEPPLEPQKDAAPRRVGIGAPRQQTFKRQNSERREKLERVRPCEHERTALSLNRKRAWSVQGIPKVRQRTRSSPPAAPRWSLPALDRHPAEDHPVSWKSDEPGKVPDQTPAASPPKNDSFEESIDPAVSEDDIPNGAYDEMLQEELDSKWILNLSMHFRDKSDREKFFLTYAEKPNKWRRVTVSCDYRQAEPGSLEMDLKELHYQRDKNLQIYEYIRDSLPEIQFYDTVTNLKLETRDGRLHVHVTEDVNEIIDYPPRHSVEHLLEDWDLPGQPTRLRTFKESEVEFHSHLSGFVYRVQVHGQDYIKKEIPGPDSVEEFLYEINALHALIGSRNVIQLQAIILDDAEKLVKGLLINFAEKGALVDLLFDNRANGGIKWRERVEWAEQVVSGLNDIHEAGFVQGDFTLSNVVVDKDGVASIIDINRRGCPVGWEPPEMEKKIRSNQRISMYIGVKSDLFQLGMVLWALAMHDDEPERRLRPLRAADLPRDTPKWYMDVVAACLSQRPQDRPSAKELQRLFRRARRNLREIETGGNPEARLAQIVEVTPFQPPTPPKSRAGEQVTDDELIDVPSSSSYRFESDSSYVGVSPAPARHVHTRDDDEPERGRRRSRDDELDLVDDSESEPQILSVSPNSWQRFEEVTLDGHPYLVSRSSFSPEELKILQGDLQEERTTTEKSIDLDPRDSLSTVAAENERSYDTSAGLAENTPASDEKLMSRFHFHDPCLSADDLLRSKAGRPRSTSAVSPLDTSQVDLTGCGSNPELEHHSRDEPSFNHLADTTDTTDRLVNATTTAMDTAGEKQPHKTS